MITVGQLILPKSWCGQAHSSAYGLAMNFYLSTRRQRTIVSRSRRANLNSLKSYLIYHRVRQKWFLNLRAWRKWKVWMGTWSLGCVLMRCCQYCLYCHSRCVRQEEFEEAGKILDDYSDKSAIASIVKETPQKKKWQGSSNKCASASRKWSAI